MGKYIKSHSNFFSQKKHQITNDGLIYYQDQLSVNGISEFSNVKGQSPIFRDGNFLMTTRISNGETRSISPARCITNSYSGNVWTDEVLAHFPTDKNSQSNTIELNFNYYSLRKFSYYGSCRELFNASLNDILKTFPAELYVLTDGTNGVNAVVSVEDAVEGHIEKVIGEGGFTNKIDNPFGIDIIKKQSALEIHKKSETDIRCFANDGFLLYDVIDRNGNASPIVGWDSNSRYWLNGTLFEGSDAEYSEALLRGEIKTCFNVGDELSQIKITTDEYQMLIKAYKGDNNSVFLLCEDNWLGYHIRPNEAVIEEWFSGLDKFESLLMPRDSHPIYTCRLEVIEQNAEDGSLTSTTKAFTMPLGEGGWNIGSRSMLYFTYVSQLQKLGATYDELFSDNLYRSMTHESIKNMDWSVRRFYNTFDDENDYETPQSNIAKMLRLIAREFDEIKYYIDGITALNTLSYSNIETNMSDYFISDSLENDGWKLIAPYTRTLNEWIEVDGQICYRDFSLSGDNVFYNTFCGVEYDVNEKENVVRPLCVNVEFVRIGDEEVMLNADKSIDFNGMNYQQEEINGVMGYNIQDIVPYMTRYVEVEGTRYFVDEATKTLTLPYNGISTTYNIEDEQDSVLVSEDKYENLTIYGIKYDGINFETKVSPNDTFAQITINRSGNSHYNVPTQSDLETETFEIPIVNGVPTLTALTTSGWSVDSALDGNNGMEYIIDTMGNKVYLNETDFNPMDDEPYLKEFSDGSKYYVSRVNHADEVVLTSSGLKSRYNAYLCGLPINKSEVLYEKIYGEPYAEMKASTTILLDSDFHSKTLNFKENSGICVYINEEAPQYTWNLPSAVVPPTTDGRIHYIKDTTPNFTTLPKSKGYYINESDWSKYKDYYKFCEANGVHYSTQQQGSFAFENLSGWTVIGDMIYEKTEGTQNKQFISKKWLLKNLNKSYRVAFVFAHLYFLDNTNGLPYQYYASWDDSMVHRQAGSVSLCAEKCEEGVKAIQKSNAQYRKTNSWVYFPIIPYIANYSVTLSASDIEHFGEDIPFGSYDDFTNIGTLVSSVSDSCGFVKKSNNNTFLNLLYNKGWEKVEANKNSLTSNIANSYNYSYNDGNISLTDKQGYNVQLYKSDYANANTFIKYLYGIDTVQNKVRLESWCGYGFAFGGLEYVSMYDNKAEENTLCTLVNDNITIASYHPIAQWSSEYIPYNRMWNIIQNVYPYKLENEMTTIATAEFSGSVPSYQQQIIQRGNTFVDSIYYQENSDAYLTNTNDFASLTKTSFNQIKSVYDILLGSYIKDYTYKTMDSSFERLNINTHIQGWTAFTGQSNTFYKLYAEREVAKNITRKRRLNEWQKENWEDGNLLDIFREEVNGEPNPYYYFNKSTDWDDETDETRFEVVDLGWFYFKNTNAVTLTDLNFNLYLTDKEDNSYQVPSHIKQLEYSEEEDEYQLSDGTTLPNLPNGIYWLSDGGEHLFANETIVKPTFKEYVLNNNGSEIRQIGSKVELTILNEEKENVIDNYYYPISECRRDNIVYTLHREFSEDADYEFNPYDVSLSPYGDGYFYKKCCIKELSNGLGVQTESTPYITYMGSKLWLCKNDDNLLSVTIDEVTYSTTKIDDTFIIIGEFAYDIKWEEVTYYRIADYHSKKTYSSSDIMYKFYKNLRLNSRQLLRKKGTIEGLESMLALFGLKSKRWYEGLTESQQISWGHYDYVIKEYTCFTNRIEDFYDEKLAKGKIAFYNSTKSIAHNNEDSNTNPYDGLPIRYISYFKDKEGNITRNQYGDDYSVNSEFRKDLYPFFDNKKHYDGETYFQMNGGWLPIYPFRFGKNNEIMLPYTDEYDILKGLHTESLRNVRSVPTLKDLVVIPKSSLVNNQIIEVQNLTIDYAIVNGGLYEVYTDTYIINDSYGNKVEKKCSYIQVRVLSNQVEVGDVLYTDDLWVSDPLSYCFNETTNETEYFVRHINLNEQSDERRIKIFLFSTDGVDIIPFDITNDALYNEEGELNCDIILYDNLNYNFFDVFKHDETIYSKYFRLTNVAYSELVGKFGWEQLLLTDNDTLRIDSIIDDYTANNPHSNIANRYDNGYEYMARYNQLFKYALENNMFNIRQYGFNGIESFENELPNIENVGFGNIISSSGSSNYSVSGDFINTRDNYNLFEDSKVHFFGNFYTNNKNCTNIFKSNHKAINKYGLCDMVEMNTEHIQFYGENPTYLALSGSVYNLSNIPCVNKSVETPRISCYVKNLQSGDTEDYCTDRIINNKVLDINFFTDYEFYSKNYLEKYKYIDDVILFYLQQMIPSTTIARINFGGITEQVLSCGNVFDVNSDGSFTPHNCDCGKTEPNDLTKIIIRKMPKPMTED